jgi:hypothetical protein
MFAIFILKAGKWVMWGKAESTNSVSLKQELAYVTDSLGLKAKIFSKNV